MPGSRHKGPVSDVVGSALAALRARALPIPMSADQRRDWQEAFNRLEAMQHFAARIDLADSLLVRVTLEEIRSFHQGGLGTRAVNGAALAALFDCALGTAGTVQFPGQRAGTCELSIKFVRPVLDAPVDLYAVAFKRAERLAFVQAELFSNQQLCARADGIVAVSGTAQEGEFPPLSL